MIAKRTLPIINEGKTRIHYVFLYYFSLKDSYLLDFYSQAQI